MATLDMTLAAPELRTNALDLPPPDGFPPATLEQALRYRRSSRAFLEDPLTRAGLSRLLWSAFGVNRLRGGGRTAPSARNWQEMDVYAVLAEGAYRYVADGHRLDLVSTEDLRASTGVQEFVAKAPLNLVYVADFARMTECPGEDQVFLAGADAGCIAQNVYLYCAAAGLATVLRALIDRRQLAKALGLRPTQRIALAQTVGMAVQAHDGPLS